MLLRLPATASIAISLFVAVFAVPAFADPILILFVGNSYNHGRYPPR